jgi:hypothetical protein
LNTFGQAFRAGGYTQASDDNLLGDGEALSIPKTLNVSLITKLRLHFISTSELSTAAADLGASAKGKKTVSTGTTEADLPDEWAIWFGGRAGKHVGFATEFGINPYAGAHAGAAADDGAYAFSFKIPIVYDLGPVKAGFVPYWTDAQGPGWGFETLSTGAVGNIRMFETSYKFSARTYIQESGIDGSNGGEAAGAMLYAWHPMGFIAYSPYLAAKGGSVTNPSFAHYVRAAITPSVAGFDIAAGVQFMTGNMGQGVGAPTVEGAIGSAATRTLIATNYLGFDAQVMGTVGIPMMLAVTYGMSDDLKDIHGKAKAGQKISVFTALLNFTLIEDLLNLGGGVRMATHTQIDATGKTLAGNDGTSAYDLVYSNNAAVAEVKINLARNMRLSVTGIMDLNPLDVATATTYKVTTSDEKGAAATAKENKLTVMLFGGF